VLHLWFIPASFLLHFCFIFASFLSSAKFSQIYTGTLAMYTPSYAG